MVSATGVPSGCQRSVVAMRARGRTCLGIGLDAVRRAGWQDIGLAALAALVVACLNIGSVAASFRASSVDHRVVRRRRICRPWGTPVRTSVWSRRVGSCPDIGLVALSSPRVPVQTSVWTRHFPARS